MASQRKRSASRKTKGPHPASVIAFSELDEEFFRAGERLSETGELPEASERTLDEMYAPIPLRHRILRALDVRAWFRRRTAQPGRRPQRAVQTSQPIPRLA
jgi:hypothetical protein